MMRMSSSTWVLLFGLSAIVVATGGACSAKQSQGSTDNTTSSSSSAGNGGGGGTGNTMSTGGSGGSGEGGGFIPGTGGSGGGIACEAGLPNKDDDADGYSEEEGDCNDCDKNVNPGAVEVIGEPDDMGNLPDPADENCNGDVDEAAPTCDMGLVLNSNEPLDAAKAIGMCAFVKSAKWVLADGSPIPVDPTKLAAFHLGHGILPKFGTNNKPPEGVNMLMLSSGTARDQGHPESKYRTFDKNYTSNAPFGFPKASPACPGVTTGLPHDAAGVQIELNVPTNAQGASFDFQFFTYEWSDFICREFNDFFVAHVEPFPMGQMDGNIAFDGQGNPISVNNAFIDSCACPGNPPGVCTAGGIGFKCSLGKNYLAGTPFEYDLANNGWSHGSTGWLRTSMPVTPGASFRIRFVTYDSSDGNLDSSTLIDNWKWSGKPGSGTVILPPPK